VDAAPPVSWSVESIRERFDDPLALSRTTGVAAPSRR
jgi:hypothetical protein